MATKESINTSGIVNTNMIQEFFIFSRAGVCLLHIDLQEEQFNLNNKAATLTKDKEDRYKLIFGLLFSMKSFVKNLSTRKNEDSLKSYATSAYKLHYLELLNGLRFVLLTKPMKQELTTLLKDIYSSLYVTFISKNIFTNKDEPFKNEIFLELVYSYLSTYFN
jgi:hypothetical protein